MCNPCKYFNQLSDSVLFPGKFIKGLRCKQRDSDSHVAVTICWRLRSSAVFLVKSLHVIVTNSVADVMLLTG